jgi:hypothetical protein
MGILNSLARTIKQRLNILMTRHKTIRWIDFLEDVIDEHNETPHRGLPIDASTGKHLEPIVMYHLDDGAQTQKFTNETLRNNRTFASKATLKVGDRVRSKNFKDKNTKESMHIPWSTDVKTIVGIEGYKYKTNDGKLWKPHELRLSKKNIEVSDEMEKAKARGKAKRRLAREGLN